MTNTTKKEIVRLVKDCAPIVDTENISDETKLIDDLQYDSLAIIDLFEQLKEKFGIECYENPDIYDSLESVMTLVSFVDKLLKEVDTVYE